MYSQIDEKGKIFTPVITKKPIRATIQTTTHLIHGDIHVRPEERVKDALQQEDFFLAVTDAVIYSNDHQELYRCKFITVNQAHIIWLLPDDEIIKPSDQP